MGLRIDLLALGVFESETAGGWLAKLLALGANSALPQRQYALDHVYPPPLEHGLYCSRERAPYTRFGGILPVYSRFFSWPRARGGGLVGGCRAELHKMFHDVPPLVGELLEAPTTLAPYYTGLQAISCLVKGLGIERLNESRHCALTQPILSCSNGCV